MSTELELRDRLVGALASVAGWSHPAEAWLLHEAVRSRSPQDSPISALEIGSYEGRTTIALGLGMAARSVAGRVIAVDPHGGEGQYEAFNANLEAAGVRDLVDPILRISHEARAEVPDGSVHVLFIDGSHEYDNVVEDIDDWTSALAPGAFVGFNDPWLPGVNRAIRHRICREKSPYRNARWMVNSVFFDYEPDAPWTAGDAARLRRLRTFLRAGFAWTSLTRAGRGDGVRSKRARRVVSTLDRLAAGPVLKAILPVTDDFMLPPG